MAEGRGVAILKMSVTAEKIFAREPLPVPLDFSVVVKTSQRG